MSDANEGEESKQKGESSGSEEFDFYFPFTKPLVLDLPTEEDRVIAAAWVQKLEVEPETEEEKQQRLNYLKLLLFVLQRGRLSGIFRKQPPSGPLQPFPPGFSILDMGNCMLEQDDVQTCGGGDAGRVPYTMEISNDLREFVASQEVPNFGVQMYYAWSSDEPIHKWSFFDEDKFPQYILDKIKQLKEIKSDEKSTITKNGCVTKKKGCELSLPEKCTKKKVKSPQEIERSQGRSFHTYMGLVGRLGNFSDKCDDDPEKFQRQDQRKGKCQRKNIQKRCLENEGEAEDTPAEEAFDNLVTGLGGLNSQNRPCLCPYPCHHSNCAEHFSKGGPQPFEDQQAPNRNCPASFRADTENMQWSQTEYLAAPNTGARRMGEQCHENEMSQAMPPQRRSLSPRPRSGSPNRNNMECPPEDNLGRFSSQGGICICSSPPCTCPCPRGTPNMAVQIGSSVANEKLAGGRTCTDQNRSFFKLSKQDPCNLDASRGRAVGPCLTSFNPQDICNPASPRSDMATLGSRIAGTTGIRSMQSEVIHCYDTQSPDPGLAKVGVKNTSWVQASGGGNKYMDTSMKKACRRDRLLADGQQNKCTLPSRKEHFDCQQQQPQLVSGNPCQQSPGPSRMKQQVSENFYTMTNIVSSSSPPLATHAACEHSPPEEATGLCPSRSNQQIAFSQQNQQNFLECENAAPPQMPSGFDESCGRSNAEAHKKPVSHAMPRSNNAGACYSNNPFAVNKDTGLLSNMANVLQGIKQRTESHREKCGQSGSRKSPVNDNVFCPGNTQTQTKAYSDQICGEEQAFTTCNRTPRNMPPGPRTPQTLWMTPQTVQPHLLGSCQRKKSFVNLPNSTQGRCNFMNQQMPHQRQIPAQSDAPYQEFAPNRMLNFQQDECDPGCDEDERDCESSDSMDGCFQECLAKPTRNEMQNCRTQTVHRDDPEYFHKTLTPGDFPNNFMDAKNQNCGVRRTSPGRTFQKEIRLNVSPRECFAQFKEPVNQNCASQKPNAGRAFQQEPCRKGAPREYQNAFKESAGQKCRTQRTAPGNRFQEVPNNAWATSRHLPANYPCEEPQNVNSELLEQEDACDNQMAPNICDDQSCGSLNFMTMLSAGEDSCENSFAGNAAEGLCRNQAQQIRTSTPIANNRSFFPDDLSTIYSISDHCN